MDTAKARSIGIRYAKEAIRAGGTSPTDHEGNCLLPAEPLPEDWHALADEMPDATDEDREAFEQAYREYMAAEIEKYQ